MIEKHVVMKLSQTETVIPYESSWSNFVNNHVCSKTSSVYRLLMLQNETMLEFFLSIIISSVLIKSLITYPDTSW